MRSSLEGLYRVARAGLSFRLGPVDVTESAPAGASTPRWTWWALLIGAGVLLAWAAFLYGFTSEPSATGRIGLVLWSVTLLSVFSSLAGLAAAVGLQRREEWGRSMAWVASAGMTVTVVAAIVGVPVLIGLASSRKLS